MSGLTVSPAYHALLLRFPPRVIRSQEQNVSYVEALAQLEEHQDSLTAEQAELAELFTLLIEDFEERHYALPKASPLEAVEFLMNEHGLKQKDLADVFGSASIVSEVLNGKRELNKDHIRRLSKRFGVSPELFF